MSKTRVHDVVTINKIKFEPYGDYVNQVYSKFDETLINNQDPHGEIEDDEIPRVEYSNGNDLEETETNKTSAILVGIMLNQCIYFFQTVEGQVSLIW